MIYLSFHNVGPGEAIAWHRGNSYVVSRRDASWIVGVNGALVARVGSRGEAETIARADTATRKPRR